jgi:hypothetical protein
MCRSNGGKDYKLNIFEQTTNTNEPMKSLWAKYIHLAPYSKVFHFHEKLYVQGASFQKERN